MPVEPQQKEVKDGVYSLITPKAPVTNKESEGIEKENGLFDPWKYQTHLKSKFENYDVDPAIRESGSSNHFNKDEDTNYSEKNLKLSLEADKSKPLDSENLNIEISKYREILKDLENRISTDPKNNYSERRLIEGAEKTKDTYENENTIGFRALSYAGSIGQSPYNLMHNVSKKLGWEIFKEEPISLIKQNEERIKVIDEEITFRKNKLSLMTDCHKDLTDKINKLEELSKSLLNVKDSSKIGELTKLFKEQEEVLIDKLNRLSNIDKIAGGDKLSSLKKELENGFKNLDKQLEYAEHTVRGVEKSAVIGLTLVSIPVTGGATAPVILGGVRAAATFAVSKNAGHVLGSALVGGSQETNFISETKDDLKDILLYKAGSVISAPVVLIGGKTFVSSGQVVGKLVPGAFATIAMRPSSMIGILIGRPLSILATKVTEVGGGVSRGVMTELLPACYDSFDSNKIDPTGELRGAKIPEWRIQLKYITTRLCTAGSASAFSHGFQGIRGSIPKLAPDNTVAKLSSKLAAESLVTVPELTLDVLNGLYIERTISPWLLGTTEKVSNEMLEQTIISSITGHIVGRSQDTAKLRYGEAHVDVAKKASEIIQEKVNKTSSSYGMSENVSSNIITSIGKKGPVQIMPSGENRRNIGTHLGDRKETYNNRALEKVHKVKGENAKGIESLLKNGDKTALLSDLVEHSNVAIDSAINLLGYKVGPSISIKHDRNEFNESLKSSFSRRAHSLSEIDPEIKSAEVLKNYVKSYVNERKAQFENTPNGSLTEIFFNLLTHVVNPKKESAEVLNLKGVFWNWATHRVDPLNSFKKLDSKIVKEAEKADDIKPGWLRSFIGSNFGTKDHIILKNYSSDVELLDKTTKKIDKLAGSSDKIPESAKESYNYVFGRSIAKTINNGILRPVINTAIGFYTLPNSSIYGSLGMFYGLTQGAVTTGSSLLKYTWAGVGAIIMPTVKTLKLDVKVRPHEAGELLARKIEGEVLLEKILERQKNNPTHEQIPNKLLNTLKKEIKETNDLFEAANIRRKGLFGFVSWAGDAVVEFIPSFSRDKSEKANLICSPELSKSIERIYRDSYRSVVDLNTTKIIDRAEVTLRQHLNRNDLLVEKNLKELLSLSVNFIKKDSVIDPKRSGDLFEEINNVLDSHLSSVTLSDKQREEPTIVKEIIKTIHEKGIDPKMKIQGVSFYDMQRTNTNSKLQKSIINEINNLYQNKITETDVIKEVQKLIIANRDFTIYQDLKDILKASKLSLDGKYPELEKYLKSIIDFDDVMTNYATTGHSIEKTERDKKKQEIDNIRKIIGERHYLSVCWNVKHMAERRINQQKINVVHAVHSSPLLLFPDLLRSVGRAPEHREDEIEGLKRFVGNFVSKDRVESVTDKFIESKGLDFPELYQKISDLRNEIDPLKIKKVEDSLKKSFKAYIHNEMVIRLLKSDPEFSGSLPRQNEEIKKVVQKLVSEDRVEIVTKFIESKKLDFPKLYKKINDLKKGMNPVDLKKAEESLYKTLKNYYMDNNKVIDMIKNPNELFDSGDTNLDKKVFAALKKGWGQIRPDLNNIIQNEVFPTIALGKMNSRKFLNELVENYQSKEVNAEVKKQTEIIENMDSIMISN